MTYHAAVRTVAPDGSDDVREVPVAGADDVDELLSLLSGEEVYTATVHEGEDDPALDVQIHESWGYLLYSGDELLAYSVGDPDSPALSDVSEAQFPKGSGVPLETLRTALVEFVTSGGGAPEAVGWQDALTAHEG
ncbi:Imm1 family immunity protein [Saccharomonospora iraqiensis]|uniref:Imm1 family immunity protein n=1 Tax=Saccharomonospora iraqiensis TaxID=52698 RepID=UPI0003FC2F7A|nr:Imm1 family immunity protein [Saccharomonospora iraqiensis]